MEIIDVKREQAQEVADLFTAVFTASEGAGEGKTIGNLAEALVQTTPEAELRVFGFRESGALIACGIFSRLVFTEDPRTVFILSPMAVATDRQGKGLGQSLLTQSLEALKQEGVDAAFTYGDPAYYGKVGFTPVTPEFAPAPQPLSQPEGWIAQSLTTAALAPFVGSSRCVDPLNDPSFW